MIFLQCSSAEFSKYWYFLLECVFSYFQDIAIIFKLLCLGGQWKRKDWLSSSLLCNYWRCSEFKMTFQLLCFGTYVKDTSMFKIFQSFAKKRENKNFQKYRRKISLNWSFVKLRTTCNLISSREVLFKYFDGKGLKIVF